MSDNREKIIQTATRMIRGGGYNAFSFREIAEEVGIKSSSVHHYFRRKEDLAAEVATIYTRDFLAALGPPEMLTGSVKTVVDHFATVFIGAFNEAGMACLCGILSHESPSIPRPVLMEVEVFVDSVTAWLQGAFDAVEPNAETNSFKQAQTVYAALSGAMAIAVLKGDVAWLEGVRDWLVKSSEN